MKMDSGGEEQKSERGKEGGDRTGGEMEKVIHQGRTPAETSPSP